MSFLNHLLNSLEGSGVEGFGSRQEPSLSSLLFAMASLQVFRNPKTVYCKIGDHGNPWEQVKTATLEKVEEVSCLDPENICIVTKVSPDLLELMKKNSSILDGQAERINKLNEELQKQLDEQTKSFEILTEELREEIRQQIIKEENSKKAAPKRETTKAE